MNEGRPPVSTNPITFRVSILRMQRSDPVREATKRNSGEAEQAMVPGSRPLEALTFAALGITSLSMPASSLLPIKGLLREADLHAFRPVLQGLREGATGEASLREPITSWVREHGLEA